MAATRSSTKPSRRSIPNLQVIATMPVKGITPDVRRRPLLRTRQAELRRRQPLRQDRPQRPQDLCRRVGYARRLAHANIGAALGDAAWMTGLERNSDLVIMASYAPLFVNVNPGGMQWSSDLIGYDACSQLRITELLRAGHVRFVPGRSHHLLSNRECRSKAFLLRHHQHIEKAALPQTRQWLFRFEANSPRAPGCSPRNGCEADPPQRP